MNDIFNTTFEMSLRVLIILNACQNKLSIDRITAIDFISVYGRDFGVSEYNLHGNNSYKFSEYAIKRQIVSQSIKELALKSYVKPCYSKDGFAYEISENGVMLCQSLNDDYANCFHDIVKKTIKMFSNYSDRKLALFINECAILMFGGK